MKPIYVAVLLVLAALLTSPAPSAIAQSATAPAESSTYPPPDELDFGDTPGGAASGIEQQEDSLENVNRAISAFNRFLRQNVLDPVVRVYRSVTPDPLQQALSNVATNLREPFNVLGSIVAGDEEGAVSSGGRFLINTTLGIGGIRDVATKAGLEYCREDIGQGLASRGVEAGTPIVAPIIGPTNVRDLPGDIVEVLISPLPGVVTIAQAGVEYADSQEALEALTEGSVDPYITERDAAAQNRLYQVDVRCKLPKKQKTTE